MYVYAAFQRDWVCIAADMNMFRFARSKFCPCHHFCFIHEIMNEQWTMNIPWTWTSKFSHFRLTFPSLKAAFVITSSVLCSERSSFLFNCCASHKVCISSVHLSLPSDPLPLICQHRRYVIRGRVTWEVGWSVVIRFSAISRRVIRRGRMISGRVIRGRATELDDLTRGVSWCVRGTRK